MVWNRQGATIASVMVATAGLTGCGPIELRKPVTVVRTSTPGVAFVMVQPVTQFDRDDPDPVLGETDRNSDYILLCDARRGDGMRCTVASEASLSRFSEHRSVVKEGTTFNAGIAADAAADVRTGTEGAASSPPAPPAQGGAR